MDDLIEFLRARLDEREAKARAATRGPWLVEHDEDKAIAVRSYDPSLGAEAYGEATVAYDPNDYGDGDFAHIAANNPEFVLADVAATRELLSEHQDTGIGLCGTCVDWLNDHLKWPCRTVRLLALPYADHPQYRESWKP